MPIFLERFVLPGLAAAVIAVILLNQLKLDVPQRISLAVGLVGFAYFAAETVYLKSLASRAPSVTAAPLQQTDAKQPPSATAPDSVSQDHDVPRIKQKSAGPNSPNIVTGDHSSVNIAVTGDHSSKQK